jgi:VCBS repeat-containing protein
MALNWRQVPGNFNDRLFEILKQLEAPSQSDRFNVHIVNGNPTIGIGFDMRRGGRPVQDAVLVGMGFDARLVAIDPSIPATPPPAPGTPQRREYDYIEQLRGVMRNGGAAGAFNAVMQQRAADADPAYVAYMAGQQPRRGSFSFASDAEVRDVFDNLWANKYRPGLFNGRPELQNDTAFHTSHEMITIASLTWNSGAGPAGLFGPGLRGAMQTGNRAKAWFEIRYGSNGGSSAGTVGAGLAKRRYYEAQLFGLYDDPGNVGAAEAKSVFRMLQEKRATIIAYELKYGRMPDGRSASSTISGGIVPLDAADTDYASILQYAQAIPGSAKRITAIDISLNPAKTAFLADLRASNPDLAAKLQDVQWVSTNIYLASNTGGLMDSLPYQIQNFDQDLMIGGTGADTLKGNQGNDLLLGNSGDDVLEGGDGSDDLVGGADSDRLFGGQGTDIYHFRANEGNDKITDSDGLGEIWVGGQKLRGAGRAEYSDPNKVPTWTTADGTVYTLDTQHKLLVITGSNLGANSSITIENFDINRSGGYLGITLAEKVANAIEGPTADDPFAVADATITDVSQTIGEKQGAALKWFSSVAPCAGDTVTFAVKGGDGSLLGLCTGADVLDLSSPVTIQLTEGQSERDFSLLNNKDFQGDQTLQIVATFTHNGVAVESNTFTLTLKDSGEFDTTLNGDLLVKTRTALSDIYRDGPQGRVLVVRQGETEYVRDANGNLIEDTAGGVLVTHNAIYGSASGGNDRIDGGLGNDLLSGGAGNDRLEGGAGDDLIAGGAGNDSIYGGEGNDYISSAALVYETTQQYGPLDNWLQWGVPAGATVLASGGAWGVYRIGEGEPIWSGMGPTPTDAQSDIIDAGAGDDHVLASWGDDRVLGGAGADQLAGLAGNDILEGGDDDDDLDGDGTVEAGHLNSVEGARHGSDFLDGGAGNDIIKGDGNADQLFGGIGNDRLYGDTSVPSSDADFLAAQYHGADYLDGEDGDDYLEGNGGADTLYGGAGADVLWGDTSATKLTGAALADPKAWGDDYLDGEAGNDQLAGGGGADTLYGGDDDDLLIGDENNPALPGQANGADYLDGEAGNDQLLGGGNDDRLYGGLGNDLMWGDDVQANVAGEIQGADYLDGEEGEDQLTGGGKDDTLYGGSDNDQLWGDDAQANVAGEFHGADYLDGEDGDDQLVGGGQADTLYGGLGADLLWGDGTQETLAGQFHGDDYLDGEAGNDQLIGGGGADTLFGGDDNDVMLGDDDELSGEFHGADSLDGGSGDDQMSGGGGADVLLGGAGNDVLLGDNGTSQLDAQWQGNDVLDGGDGNDQLSGHGGDDTLLGGAGDDVLDGGNGADRLEGGAGNDTYAILGSSGRKTIVDEGGTMDVLALGWNIQDIRIDKGSFLISNTATGQQVHIETNADGACPIEQVQLVSQGSAVQWSFEQLAQTVGINVTGTDGADLLEGTMYRDTLVGGAGSDTLIGLAGDDTYVLGSDTTDVIVEEAGGGLDTVEVSGNYSLQGVAHVENVTLTSSASGILSGNELDNTLRGNAGNDVIDGRQGADRMQGGAGDDTYYAGDVGDTIVEAPGEGNDRVYASLDWTLSSGVEELYLEGSAHCGTGNELNNVIHGGAGSDLIQGGAGDDILDGGAGADTMYGGTGSDTYYVDDENDVIVDETDWDATDLVIATVSVVLPECDNRQGWNLRAIENVTLLGTANINATGNRADNLLIGNEGDNRLDGGSGGLDTLAGGAGNDTYVVNRPNARIIEAEGAGIDTVEATISLTLAENVENLVLSGPSYTGGFLFGNGNALDNVLVGSQGSDWLDGAAGADTLAGGLGNDVYVVADAADVVKEEESSGRDRVISRLTGYTLGHNVEELEFATDQASTGIGNELDNLILGGSAGDVLDGAGGNDTLDGRAGADTMAGGLGDDVYRVDSPADVVNEETSSGRDRVISTATAYTLAPNVEELEFDTDQASTGIGNELDNLILGGSAGDVLDGAGGNDTLDGRGGADLLRGGDGDDRYYVDDGQDTIVDTAGIDTVVSALDTYTLGAGLENLDVVAAGVGIGNELDNVLTAGEELPTKLFGMAGDDTFKAHRGSHRLVGGTGDDVYDVASALPPWWDPIWRGRGPVIEEQAGEGYDKVVLRTPLWPDTDQPFQAGSATCWLAPNVEEIDASNLVSPGTLMGNELDNRITGGNGTDVIYGNAGDDHIDADPASAAGAGLLTSYDNDLVGRMNGFDAVLRTEYSNFCSAGPRPELATWDVLVDFFGIRETLEPADDPTRFIAVPTIRLTDSGPQAGMAYWPNQTWLSLAPDTTFTIRTDGSFDVTNLEGEALEELVDWRNYIGPFWVQLKQQYGARAVWDLQPEQAAPPPVGSVRTFPHWHGGGANIWEGRMTVDWTIDRLPIPLAVEGDTVHGGAGDDRIDGGFGRDRLYGDEGNDTLLGGYSAPAIVESHVQSSDNGSSLVIASFGFDSDADYLDGGAGIDLMQGGVGDDTYVVDGEATVNADGAAVRFRRCDVASRFGMDQAPQYTWVTDTVVESAGEGHDVVHSTASVNLAGIEIEEVRLMDGGPIADLDATTGQGSQALYGNAGANRLDGGQGADQMAGGAGDDIYVVDDVGDTVTENATEGFDIVRTVLDGYALGANFEGLVLEGAADLTGQGNDADNLLVGNTGRNGLDGGLGNDTLAGWRGDDILRGGAGADTYVIARGDGFDVVEDLEGDGTLHCSGDIVQSDITVLADGNDLIVRVGDGAASAQGAEVRLRNWIGAAERVTRVTFCDGTSMELVEPNRNSPPVAQPDEAGVLEDGPAAGGNVLANDSDPDADELTVQDPGTRAGAYGTLQLHADGSYWYELDSTKLAVRSLAHGQQLVETFEYTAADSHGETSGAVLTVRVTGVNDAPELVAPAADATVEEGKPLAIELDEAMFTDIDQGDVLTYSARLADGGSLPAWLVFDPHSLTLAGTPPHGEAGQIYSVRVTATDRVGATAEDILAITITECVGLNLVGSPGNDILVGSPCNDTLDGAAGADVMEGGAGNDTYHVDAYVNTQPGKGNEGLGNGEDPPPPGHDFNWNDGPGTSPGNPGSQPGTGGSGSNPPSPTAAVGDTVIELADQGWDTVSASVSYVLPQHVEAVRLQGKGALDAFGNDLSNWMVGNAGANVLGGNGGNDLLSGGAGADYLYGGSGNDVLEGQAGDDVLYGGDGGDALFGGAGADALKAVAGAAFIAGGKQNDAIVVGNGATVIAFNRGDGVDTVKVSANTPIVVSLGGGIRVEDTALRRKGSALIIDVGNGEAIRFNGWYAEGANRPELRFQFVGDGAGTAADALHDNKVEWFDGQALATAFDRARQESRVSRWDIMNAALASHLGGSDTAALGGDLAYHYGTGSLAGMGLTAAAEALGATEFGAHAQAWRSTEQIRTGIARLAG